MEPDNGEMKMRNGYQQQTQWRRERVHSREANFGSGRRDLLSRMFGKLNDEYEIYKANAPAPHKSFDEWLES